ncbi:MAG: hypothetical protein IH968_03855 [Gemmatimonadetes bacterium]|nr:hypothetical protein [Gemmatimonadota bacterium]
MAAHSLPRRVLLRLLAAALSSLFAVSIFEILLRIVNYHPRISNRLLYVATGRDILPHTLRPGYEGYHAGKKLTIDSDGYRVVRPDATVSDGALQPPDKVVLILGDSLVFGQGLADTQTIASQLQDRLARRGQRYRVRNIGVPGYTSWNEYAALVDYWRQYRADMVIVVYVPNDVSLDNDHLGLGSGTYSLVANTRFHRFTQLLYSNIYTAYLVREGVKKAATWSLAQEGRRVRSQYFDEDAMDYSMEGLSRIKELCEREGVVFSVGIYRDLWHYTDPMTSSRYEEAIVRNLEERGMSWFLVSSHIEELPLREARVHWNDPHPSSKAVGLIVGDILKEIDSRL